MKLIILLICCGVGILTFLLSLFGYPFIASLFDAEATSLSLFIGIPLFVLTLSVTLCFSKKKFVRICIIIPCALSVLLSSIVNYIRFGESNYHQGFCYENGVYNRWGFKIIPDAYGMRRTVDENQNEVFINIHIDEVSSQELESEWDEEKEEFINEYKHVYNFSFSNYDLKGNLLKQYEEEREIISNKKNLNYADEQIVRAINDIIEQYNY